MIILLIGPDDFRREEKRKEIISEYQKKKKFLNLRIFDFDEDEISGLESFMANRSIFEDTKLAVLNNISSLGIDSRKEKLAPILKSAISDKSNHILISEKGKLPADLKFLLKKPVVVQEFDYLSAASWQNFIKAKSAEAGLKLTPLAVGFLAKIFQNDSWGLATELEKLSFLKNKNIDKKDLEFLNSLMPIDFWSELQELKSLSVTRRFGALEKLFSKGENVGKIFNVLSAIWPQKISEFAKLDLMIKSGKLEYEEALLSLII
jgi:DNA polymerase III delta subunit